MPNAFKQILRRLRATRPRRGRQLSIRQIDCLETRLLPTAVVTFTGAAMTIKGDTGDNHITVEKVGNQVHVDANGGSISVLGADVPEFSFNLKGAFNLTASFQGGSDVLELTGPLQLKSVVVTLGDGDNAFILTDASLSGKLTVTGGSGDDAIGVVSSVISSTTSVNLGAGNDSFNVLTGATFSGATTINTGAGEDTVYLLSTSRVKFGGTLTVSTGDDADMVFATKLDTKAVSIDSGNGDDYVAFTDALLAGALTIKTGAGEDTLASEAVFQSGKGAVLLDSGADKDVVEAALGTFTGATTINLGSGTANELLIEDQTFNAAFTLNSQGTGDEINIEQLAGFPGATTFAKAAKFNLGGASTVLIGTADPDNKVKFLSTVSFASATPNSTLTLFNTSFASAPKLKNVVIV